MTATLPTQADVDKIAAELAPRVVRIRLNVGQDWSEHPAMYFRIILSDEASKASHLADLTGEIAGRLSDELRLATLDHIPYFRFRSESEQRNLQDPAWD